MGDRSAIEWTDATWNPVRGCSRVSEGCRNCYAERVAARFSGPGLPFEGLATMRNGEPRWTGEVRVVEEHLRDPLRWRRPRRVFVNSMSDLFHEKLSDDDIRRVFNVMEEARRHTFQVLTKRPHRMHEFVDDYFRWRSPEGTEGVSPPSNIWLGVSAENQATADERIPLLLQTPAAIRFVSAEPLLGPIDFDSSDKDGLHALGCGYEGGHRACPESPQRGTCAGLDWVIVGGESGPGARPMQTDWAVSIRDQCVAAGVPYFFKQWGEWGDDGGDGLMRVGKKRAGRLLDGRTWDEFPPSATPASAETGRP